LNVIVFIFFPLSFRQQKLRHKKKTFDLSFSLYQISKQKLSLSITCQIRINQKGFYKLTKMQSESSEMSEATPTSMAGKRKTKKVSTLKRQKFFLTLKILIFVGSFRWNSELGNSG